MGVEAVSCQLCSRPARIALIASAGRASARFKLPPTQRPEGKVGHDPTWPHGFSFIPPGWAALEASPASRVLVRGGLVGRAVAARPQGPRGRRASCGQGTRTDEPLDVTRCLGLPSCRCGVRGPMIGTAYGRPALKIVSGLCACAHAQSRAVFTSHVHQSSPTMD
jgi:hypothetical protein